MVKFHMPSAKEFYRQKKLYGPKRDQVWVYLESEMRRDAENNIKPYNKKVGNWLVFLKKLRYFYFCEARFKYLRLCSEVGPDWYFEFSKEQREILDKLKENIKSDRLECLPRRVRASLNALGVDINFPKSILLKSMDESNEDPGLFMWYLYTNYFKISPCERLPYYDMNQMLMLSSIVFIDLAECIQSLDKLVILEERPQVPPLPPKKKERMPNFKFGAYLHKQRAGFYCPHPDENQSKVREAVPLANKVKLRSQESYTNLIKNTNHLFLRKLRVTKKIDIKRVCNYKFWEPPPDLRDTDPEAKAVSKMLKLVMKKPKRSHLKHKPPGIYDNTQYLLGPVTYIARRPVHLIGSVAMIAPTYNLIHGGHVAFKNRYIDKINGFSPTPVPQDKEDCHCLQYCQDVMEFLIYSKCRCGHAYGEENNIPLKTDCIYFHPPTRTLPHMFEYATIHREDEFQYYTEKELDKAMMSESEITVESPRIGVQSLTEQQLLMVFLAELADTPLLIPHLPNASYLLNLKEWVRKRVHGKLSPEEHKHLLLKSQRRWLDLKHMDMRARAYWIPFTSKQLSHFNWSHRYETQKLYKMLQRNFEKRCRVNQMEQSRLWWSTMAYYQYPCKPFLDVFFTYMPGRFKDTHVINPYTKGTGLIKFGTTCPLDVGILSKD